MVGVGFLRRRRRHPEDLAVEASRADIAERRILPSDKHGGAVVVFLREGNLLTPLEAHRHGRDDRVVFIGDEIGNYVVPLLDDELAFELADLAERIGDIDVESLKLVVGIEVVEGWKRTFDGNSHGRATLRGHLKRRGRGQ